MEKLSNYQYERICDMLWLFKIAELGSMGDIKDPEYWQLCKYAVLRNDDGLYKI
jgi:hypothetical protein